MEKSVIPKFFNGPVWQAFLERLRSVVGNKGQKISPLMYETGLNTFRLDLVLLGNKGMTVESLVKLCEALSLSPTWLLFGIGPQKLGESQESPDIQLFVDRVIDGIIRLPKKDRRKFKHQFLMLIEGLTDDEEPPEPPDVPPRNHGKTK